LRAPRFLDWRTLASPLKTVLIDDAEDVRRVVALQLQLSGDFEIVGSGATGREAVELAERFAPDLLLLDVSMPDMDGLAALPKVMDASPGTRIVMLSGFAGPEIEQEALALGATAFLDKGTSLEALPNVLLEILSQSGEERIGSLENATPTSGDAKVLVRHVERFRSVFDQAAIGMATMTLTGTIARTNVVFARLFGVDQSALIGRNYASLLQTDQMTRVEAAIYQIGNGESDVREVDHSQRSGDRYMYSTFASVLDDDDRPLYIFAQTDDVTPNREATEQLRASEERFRLLVESVRDYAIFMLDPGGNVTTWNLGAERMKGYAADEIMGKHFRIFYPGEAQESHHPETELAIAVRESRYQEEGVRVRKDGSEFFADVLITALFDDHHELAGFAKVTRDITEQRRNAEAQKESASQLQAAAKSMVDFVAVVAHELRNPVTAINGAAKILREHWAQLDVSDRDEMLLSIDGGGRRLQGLVEDLLTASRLEAGSFDFNVEDFAMADALAQILAELPAGQSANVDVVCGAEVWARGDRVRLGQIIANLVSNASKYGAAPISIDVWPKDSFVEVKVHDAGGGIPAAIRDRLFEKFAYGPSDRGTGLGLFIVRELARGQDGDAWYESAGDGHAFAFSLPAGESFGARLIAGEPAGE
jgi:PAS domain S-box-containing protein